ncbi:MAG: FAD-binding oxidoreductase, partial [Acidobacteriota bacterium]|nr:FAD-binding oxidoreductase [Acidobacteriota bacterium]
MNRQTEIAAAEWADPVFGGAADLATREAYAVDGLVPQAVLFPRSQDALAETLKAASERGLALIPCRNKTKLSTGNIPRRYDAALCLKEMNAVWRYEPDDLTASAEAGIKLGDFQRLLSRHGLWIPVDPQGGEKASLGGIVAANASGPLRLKFGTPRDFVIGMKIATPAGKIVKAGGHVVKNVAGYDFCRLLTGSYGALGVIAEISFKLFPLPEGRSSWRAAIPNLKAAREFRRRILDSPLGPMRMVLMDGVASALAAQAPVMQRSERKPEAGAEMWLEFGGSEEVINRCARSLAELAKSVEISFQPLGAEAAEVGWG